MPYDAVIEITDEELSSPRRLVAPPDACTVLFDLRLVFILRKEALPSLIRSAKHTACWVLVSPDSQPQRVLIQLGLIRKPDSEGIFPVLVPRDE